MICSGLIIGEGEASQDGILSFPVHQQNQRCCVQVMQEICETFLDSFTPQQKRDMLSLHLGDIARKLIENGLDLNAYSYDIDANSSFLQFSKITLWEGGLDSHSEIPLALFIYVWPPEHLAKKVAVSQHASSNDPRQNHYATNIHSHPLSCALTVLKGTICQENYQAIKGWPFNVAQKKDEEILREGMSTYDDNHSLFIHRIVCRNEGVEPAITLHAYGASTAKEVHNSFITFFNRSAYPYILSENGQLVYQAW